VIAKDEGGRVQVRFDGEDGKIFSVRTAGIKRTELRGIARPRRRSLISLDKHHGSFGPKKFQLSRTGRVLRPEPVREKRQGSRRLQGSGGRDGLLASIPSGRSRGAAADGQRAAEHGD